MKRHAPTLLVAALLAATAVGFAVTQHLKLERPALSHTLVDRLFSPVCGCATAKATIAFRLRDPDRVTVTVRDAAGDPVAVLARRRPLPSGDASWTWDGRRGDGRVVPDGSYRPVVELARAGRTIDLQTPIEVDTQRPRLAVTAVVRRRPRRFTIAYRLSEPAHVVVLADGKRSARTHKTRQASSVDWYGRAQGRPLRPGRHRLSVVAVDLAGNRSAPVAFSVRLGR